MTIEQLSEQIEMLRRHHGAKARRNEAMLEQLRMEISSLQEYLGAQSALSRFADRPMKEPAKTRFGGATVGSL